MALDTVAAPGRGRYGCEKWDIQDEPGEETIHLEGDLGPVTGAFSG